MYHSHEFWGDVRNKQKTLTITGDISGLLWKIILKEALKWLTLFTEDNIMWGCSTAVLSHACAPAHAAFGIICKNSGIPTAAGSQPVCSLFVSCFGARPLGVSLGGKQMHIATLPHLAFQQWQLTWSINFSKPADGWMPLQTATVVMPTVNKRHLLFWGTLAFPASSLLRKHGTCAHEIITQLLFSAIYL